MLQVLLKQRTKWIPFGPKVEDPDQACVVVKVLDFMYEAAQLPPHLDFYHAHKTHLELLDELTGLRYDYTSGDPAGNPDGWCGPGSGSR